MSKHDKSRIMEVIKFIQQEKNIGFESTREVVLRKKDKTQY